MFGVAASGVPGGMVAMFHGIQVAVMLALMTNVTQFAWWKCKGKSQKPVYMLVVATLLVMVQPTCMLVIGSYTDAALADGHDPPFGNFFFDGDDGSNALVPNTAVGWSIQVFGTYLGFIIMFVAVFDVTKLGTKLRKKWRAIRDHPAAQ